MKISVKSRHMNDGEAGERASAEYRARLSAAPLVNAPRTAYKRRPAAAMGGWALALAWKQREADRASAHTMHVFMRLRDQVTPEARMRLLAGLARGGL